jgi:hypothetical protein
MATATSQSVPQPRPPRMYMLAMNEQEAAALMVILNRIGGSPTTTRRGLTDAIQNAMLSAGADRQPPSDDIDPSRGSSICFR